MKKQQQRPDEDYVALDDAIRTMEMWREEIVEELAKQCVSWKAFRSVIKAMERVHSPEEVQ